MDRAFSHSFVFRVNSVLGDVYCGSESCDPTQGTEHKSATALAQHVLEIQEGVLCSRSRGRRGPARNNIIHGWNKETWRRFANHFVRKGSRMLSSVIEADVLRWYVAADGQGKGGQPI